MNRRQLLYGGSIGMASGVVAKAGTMASPAEDEQPKHRPLDLSNYQPTSMLHVRETRVERARYPVIDIHTHVTEAKNEVNGVPLGSERDFHATPTELIPIMDRKDIRSMV